MKSKFIKCKCNNEVLELEVFDNEVYLSIYSQGLHYNNKLSIKQRIRYCWKVITKGKPFNDSMVIRKPDALDLVSEIFERFIVKAKGE